MLSVTLEIYKRPLLDGYEATTVHDILRRHSFLSKIFVQPRTERRMMTVDSRKGHRRWIFMYLYFNKSRY
jgi:hypothetical protein